jgi:hypothetical protein
MGYAMVQKPAAAIGWTASEIETSASAVLQRPSAAFVSGMDRATVDDAEVQRPSAAAGCEESDTEVAASALVVRPSTASGAYARATVAVATDV